MSFYYARQYDQTIEQLRKTLDLDPNFIPAHYALGRAYLQKSMHKEAIAEFEKWTDLPDLGCAYAVTGRRREAQKVLDKLNERSKQKYVSPVPKA